MDDFITVENAFRKLDFQGTLDLDCFETLVLFISLELKNPSSTYANYFENIQDSSNDVLGKFEKGIFTLISKKNPNSFFILLLTWVENWKKQYDKYLTTHLKEVKEAMMNKFKIIQKKILPVIRQISTDNFEHNEIRRAYDLLSTRNIRVEEPNKFPPWFR